MESRTDEAHNAKILHLYFRLFSHISAMILYCELIIIYYILLYQLVTIDAFLYTMYRVYYYIMTRQFMLMPPNIY